MTYFKKIDDLKMAQGQAVPADATDIAHDEARITNPNLHRRVDNEDTPKKPGELTADTYALTVSGLNSYRTTQHIIHDENSTESEVP